MAPQPFSLEVQHLEEQTVVRFPGSSVRLGGDYHPVLQDQLVRLAEEAGSGGLVLHLDNVEFLFSDVLGTLVAVHKKLRARGGHLLLCNPTPEVYELFEVTRLHKVLDIRWDEQEPNHQP